MFLSEQHQFSLAARGYCVMYVVYASLAGYSGFVLQCAGVTRAFDFANFVFCSWSSCRPRRCFIVVALPPSWTLPCHQFCRFPPM